MLYSNNRCIFAIVSFYSSTKALVLSLSVFLAIVTVSFITFVNSIRCSLIFFNLSFVTSSPIGYCAYKRNKGYYQPDNLVTWAQFNFWYFELFFNCFFKYFFALWSFAFAFFNVVVSSSFNRRCLRTRLNDWITWQPFLCLTRKKGSSLNSWEIERSRISKYDIMLNEHYSSTRKMRHVDCQFHSSMRTDALCKQFILQPHMSGIVKMIGSNCNSFQEGYNNFDIFSDRIEYTNK